MSAGDRFEFVDTNILIYAHDPTTSEKCVVANALLDRLWDEDVGCVSVQVLQEFYVVGSRKFPGDSTLRLRAAVETFGTWRVFQPAADDILAAIDLHLRHKLSFWDAMIVHSAQELGCSTLWSEDLNHEQVIGGVTIRNPFVAAHAPPAHS